MILALALFACGGSSELELTVALSEAALDGLPAFPVDLVVDFGVDGEPRPSIPLCERLGDTMELDVPAPPFERCPSSTRVTGILVPHTGACETGVPSTLLDFPEDDALALGEIVIFDDDFCDVLEQRTLTIEPLVIDG